MNYGAFLERVVDDGIAAATESYSSSSDKLRGAVCGFKRCRNADPQRLLLLLAAAREKTGGAHMRDDANCWEYRCCEAEIEWVCNVVSAALMNQGEPVIAPPTATGLMQAADILGVARA